VNTQLILSEKLHEGGIEFEKYIATSHVDMKKALAWHWECQNYFIPFHTLLKLMVPFSLLLGKLMIAFSFSLLELIFTLHLRFCSVLHDVGQLVLNLSKAVMLCLFGIIIVQSIRTRWKTGGNIMNTSCCGSMW